jgi:very-short-patch-repair endonuclease
MPPDLRDAIADELATFPAGLTIANLGRRLSVSRLDEVAIILGDLQDRRLVRLAGARWRWIGPPRTRPRGTKQQRDNRDATHLGPSGVTTSTGSIGIQPDSLSSGTATSRWDVFRRLCRYYSEFVRLEERASVRVYANREFQDFVQIPGGVDWRGLEAGEPVIVQLPLESGVFVRRGLSGNKLPYWFLGLPVDMFRGIDRQSGEEWISLEPILVVAVRPEMRDECTVVLEPLGSLEVNPGWLQRRFKRADQRIDFLATVGLDEGAAGATDDGDAARFRLTTFRMALDALCIAYKEWWREYPSLDGLQTEPPLTSLRNNGLHNRALLVSQPKLKYAKRLFEELLALADPLRTPDADLDRTALSVLFPHEPAPSANGTEPAAAVVLHLAEYHLLNEEQRQAVVAAMQHRLTVLTGPPGTGKSVTVAHVMVNMALQRRSVLFASRNHQAIEAVEPRLNAIVEPETLVMRPTRPWGQDARTADWQVALMQLLTKPANPGTAEALAAAQMHLAKTLQTRAEIEAAMRRLLDLTDVVARREQQSHESEEALDPAVRQLVAPIPDMPGTDTVDALVGDLTANDLAGRPWLAKLLVRAWHRLLRLIGRDPERPLRDRCAAVAEAVGAATGDHLVPVARSALSFTDLASRLQSLRPFLAACEARRGLMECRQQIEALPDRAELDQQLAESTEQLRVQTQATLRLLAEVSGAEIDPETRQRFAELRAGIENHRGSANQDRFERVFAESLPDLLAHYPLWAVSNLSVYKAMPLAAAAADLLIIDEASQCDIPSVVPLLFRAKRALIVGDPMQLGHITSMSRPAELRIRQMHDLVGPQQLERFSVGVNSIYDLAAHAANRDIMVQLRAHYRCHPHIAGYSNRLFYNSTLRVMTNVARLKNVPGMAGSVRACEWTDVRGEIIGASAGCFCPAQIQAVLEQLDELRRSDFAGTVGVVTPFRIQANRIQDAVHARFPSEQIDRWQFLAHTVDGFQGDERDVILFSLVGGPGMPAGSLGFLASAPNRFNVAISRARSFVRVIGNRDWAASCGILHITELVKVCDEPDAGFMPRPDLIGPVWEPRLAAGLKAAGLEFRQQYPACGYYLDFAIISEHVRLDVEVDGETWHRGSGGHRLSDDVYRDHVLKAAGWRVLRFWVYELREDIDGCLTRIRATWNGGRGNGQ